MRTLERSLGLSNVVAISIGAMLGGEIFVLPAAAAQMTGPSLWLAYLVAAVLVLPAALSKSELATAMPEAGGAYLYIERAMGPFAGTIAGIGLWLSLLLKSTFALAVLGDYLGVVVEVPAIPVALVLLAMVGLLNMVGVRKVGRAQAVVVIICLAALGSLVALGLREIEAHPPAAGAWMTDGPMGFMSAIGLVFVSYAGVTKIAAVAEEIRDESRNIPRGILISLGVMGILYTLVAVVLVDVLGLEALADDGTPIISLAGSLVGPWGETALALVASLALLGMANAGLLAASRFPFAMGRDRILPEALARVNPRFSTPIPAIVLTAVMMAVMLVSLDVIGIAKLASAFMIAAFCAVNLAVVILRESGSQWYQPPFRAPGYPYVQLVGAATGIAILVSMGGYAVGGLLAGITAGALLYVGYARARVSRLGVLRKMTKRHDLLHPQRAKTGAYTTTNVTTAVMLLGHEPSPEALAQLGMTLSVGGVTEVCVMREVPEQTDMSTLADVQDDRITSLERRITGLAAERGTAMRFDVHFTRDLRETLFDSAGREQLRWVVLAWRERAARGIIVRNPLDWLKRQLPCNVAVFKDAGIRTYRRIMVVAKPGPHDALLARTADDLAGLFRAETTFVRYLPIQASDAEVERVRGYHRELARLCHQQTHSDIVRGEDEVEALVHASARYDLVVLGAPPERSWHRSILAADEERITEGAHCAVLQLRAPRVDQHAALGSAPATAASASMSTGSARIVPAAASLRQSFARKDELFSELGRIFEQLEPGIGASAVTAALWERERQESTSMGRGVVLPHASVPAASRTRFVVITLAEPLTYGDDADDVDVVLCLVGPEGDRETHFRLLRFLAQLIVDGDLLGDLRRATREEEVHAAFAVDLSEDEAPREPASAGESA